MSDPKHTLLSTIDSPADLRRLPRERLPQLADELREHVLHSVSRTGGHLSSNLGTVELTIALHYAFDTPDDRIIWDVGHQSYPHKILTGRRDAMGGLRQYGGISGFPRRCESEYDTFGTAHSSTSISAAVGMAVASRNQGHGKRQHIAVIGDGSMSAGMAFEALNNAGVMRDCNVIVILNDNEMSISPPVGALHRHLTKLMSGNFYAAARRVGQKILDPVPPLREFARKFEEHTKGMLGPGTIFEEFGFNYLGPIDGHDLDTLVSTLTNLRHRGGPQFLHVVTRKGAGYKLAEADPILYHGPGKFDPVRGIVKTAVPTKPTYTSVFSDWICDMAAKDSRLMAITPAMREGSGLVKFEQQFPTRYFDVGIAEQHAVTFAAGIACEGAKPVVAIYSTFLQRAYDQLIHDVALQNLDVTFAIDRAGLVGADGATHAGNYDYAFLRCIPNMVVMAPADEAECRRMLTTAYEYAGPAAVRYPRGSGPGVATERVLDTLPLGKGEIRRQSGAAAGGRVAILAFGSMVAPALAAAEQLDATVANMRFVKPLDADLVRELAASHDAIVTVEEGAIMGGAGSAVTEALAAHGIVLPVLQLGLPDRFVDHGEQGVLLAECGLDAAGIARSVRERFGGRVRLAAVAGSASA
ncbi:1-deoxy-D-xylulose-5-phosphate synthase [Derxia gummosa]|uniref:1-deoxy-D-xylulose-5-phosphate synthase n=1 Tax=Derxia gummosa DSM 723 TaxID=1121388 RepID=A0A8B6X1M5_9BURK|nr:1-deoxy-D-xylulose-5-phosphate synthase [Derxia gummosa]